MAVDDKISFEEFSQLVQDAVDNMKPPYLSKPMKTYDDWASDLDYSITSTWEEQNEEEEVEDEPDDEEDAADETDVKPE